MRLGQRKAGGQDLGEQRRQGGGAAPGAYLHLPNGSLWTNGDRQL